MTILHRLVQMKSHKISTDIDKKNLCPSVSFNLCPSVRKLLNSPTGKVEVKLKVKDEIYRRENSFEQESYLMVLSQNEW